MGLLTSLALMLTPLARRSLIPIRSRESELEAKIETLERELSEARADAAHWETLTHRWQARYEVRERTQMMHAMARYQAAHANALTQQQGMLSDFCNCIPARHDALIGSIIQVEGLP